MDKTGSDLSCYFLQVVRPSGGLLLNIIDNEDITTIVTNILKNRK